MLFLQDMYHSHTDDSLIQQKIQAILRCFIVSEIAPNLHIDITPEMAEKIMDKRPREMGPYVFREAQVRFDDCKKLSSVKVFILTIPIY